ncbi:hypothetical protein A7982_13877 [Minicystis rosea]|nr:hypothetical protein A7982_13877 [Minicystis rosea]
MSGPARRAPRAATFHRCRTDRPKGGEKIDTIATGQNPFDIAADAGAVYVTMQGDGNIVRIVKQ